MPESQSVDPRPAVKRNQSWLTLQRLTGEDPLSAEYLDE